MEDRKAETGGGGNHNKVLILLREKYVLTVWPLLEKYTFKNESSKMGFSVKFG